MRKVLDDMVALDDFPFNGLSTKSVSCGSGYLVKLPCKWVLLKSASYAILLVTGTIRRGHHVYPTNAFGLFRTVDGCGWVICCTDVSPKRGL